MRYLSFPEYCMKAFGRKLYKIPLDASFTCPNRDGKISSGGCIFCDEGGSGDFALKYNGQKLDPANIPYVRNPNADPGSFIGYFQAYTNTYAPVPVLRKLFENALEDEALAGISIATRPDCMGQDVLDLLKQLKSKYPEKFIWIELGLQSVHEETARFINRGYSLDVFEQCLKNLKDIEIPVIVHIIIGLPHETEDMIYQTVDYLSEQGIDGIKLQLLHVLKHTKLSQLYHAGEFDVLSEEEYLRILCGCIARLDENVVIHRLTGDGNPEILEAPLWSLHKKKVLNDIGHALKINNIRQGCLRRTYE